MPEVKCLMSTLYKKEPGVLSSYMDSLYDEQGKCRNTAYNYYMTVRSLAKFLKRERKGLACMPDEVIMHGVSAEEMLDITEREWFAYLDYYEHTCHEAKTSLAVRISVIRGFYRWLTASCGLDMLPHIENTARPVIARQKFTTVTEKMENKLLRHMTGALIERNACIVRIFLRCGLGLQEICDLDMEDVELRALQVRDGNGGSRAVPTDELVIEAIDRYVSERIPPKFGGNPFFVSAEGGRMRRGAVEKMLRKAVKQAGYEQVHISIRDLQMTAKARLVAKQGLDAAAPITNVTSYHYFRRVFSKYAKGPESSATSI